VRDTSHTRVWDVSLTLLNEVLELGKKRQGEGAAIWCHCVSMLALHYLLFFFLKFFLYGERDNLGLTNTSKLRKSVVELRVVYAFKATFSETIRGQFDCSGNSGPAVLPKQVCRHLELVLVVQVACETHGRQILAKMCC
jgi:hypothetical protein